MSKHIYAFGSICRGDIQPSSDIDLLAVVDGYQEEFDTARFSIYSYERILELWNEGNPFAWHLHLESRFLYGTDNTDFLKSLDTPASYKNCYNDCVKFSLLIDEAITSLDNSKATCTFDLSTIFLGIRNIATCYSLGCLEKPIFSRDSALKISQQSIKIDLSVFKTLENARILTTRGYGTRLTHEEILNTLSSLKEIKEWATEMTAKTEGL